MNNKQCGICVNCVPQINGGSGFNNCDEAHAAQLAEDNAPQFTKEQLIEHINGRTELRNGLMNSECIAPSFREYLKFEMATDKIALAALTEDSELQKAKQHIESLQKSCKQYYADGVRAGWEFRSKNDTAGYNNVIETIMGAIK